MSFRFTGLAPCLALLAAGAAHAQPSTTGGGGSMAYPDPLPSGQVHTTINPGRDTGSMALPNSGKGVAAGSPAQRDTGSMALPTGSGGVTTTPAPTPRFRRRAAATAAPSASGRAAASEMAIKPSDTPVPYTDFAPAAPTASHGPMRHAPMRHAPVHRAAVHHAKPPASATTASTPAASTPAASTPPAATK